MIKMIKYTPEQIRFIFQKLFNFIGKVLLSQYEKIVAIIKTKLKITDLNQPEIFTEDEVRHFNILFLINYIVI